MSEDSFKDMMDKLMTKAMVEYAEVARVPTAPTPDHDTIHSPPHYTQGGIECIDALQAALTPEEYRGALKANVIKYLWRERHKGGVESLRKAAWYLARLIKASS